MLEFAFDNIFRTDADGCVTEAELRRVFQCQNRVQSFGLEEDQMELLLDELGKGAPPAEGDSVGRWRVPLRSVIAHPAFLGRDPGDAWAQR